jgi:ADP-heptose:LPS heptosyltransferase/lauroyl/myristoyl acyltransferase
VLKFLLQVSGWAIAHTPERALRALTALSGDLLLTLSPRRRRLVFSNLHHAFPEKPRAWRRRIARKSSRRLFETALLSLASPYLGEARLRRIVRVTEPVIACFRRHYEAPHPLLVTSPHIAYWESLTWLALFLPMPLREFGIIFRPLDNPTADAWVKSTRERHGMKLLSRKEGLAQSFRILKRDGTVGVLFDQNAGIQGALTTLLGRVCSTTELPGLLAERSGAKVVAFYPRRLDFWRVQHELVEIPHDGAALGVTLGLNRWLEQTLAADDNLCASWLWSHDRWRHQDVPEKRFRLESKRDLLPAEFATRGPTALPRKTRLWIRLPNWLGDVVMAVPLLRALRAGRPDAEITLLGKAAFRPLFETLGLGERFIALPTRGLGYFSFFRKLRAEFPDAYLLLTNSPRGDFEAWLTGCRQRFGLRRPGRRRPLLTHTCDVPADFDESRHHQLELWENLFRHFGLERPLDRAPLAPVSPPVAGDDCAQPFVLGLIAGSENTPEKRWPVAHWRALATRMLAEFPQARLRLFGTPGDHAIAEAISAGFSADRIENLAGRTDLAAFMDALRDCRALVTNDTGGMHLANLLGVPLLALFGPTNPVRTGPVFSSPCVILQPENCPPTGGGRLAELSPDTVLHALRARLRPSADHADRSRSLASIITPIPEAKLENE